MDSISDNERSDAMYFSKIHLGKFHSENSYMPCILCIHFILDKEKDGLRVTADRHIFYSGIIITWSG